MTDLCCRGQLSAYARHAIERGVHAVDTAARRSAAGPGCATPGRARTESTFLASGDKTCIDCHKGIAHRLPHIPPGEAPTDTPGQDVPQPETVSNTPSHRRAERETDNEPMAMQPPDVRNPFWPALDYPAWRDTALTFQLWTQIVGKVRLALSPWLNHGWQVPLYVNARGLGTSPIHAGARIFEIDFDLVDHRFVLRTPETGERGFALEPMSVAAFYRRCMAQLDSRGDRRGDQPVAQRSVRSDPLHGRRVACVV